MLETLLGILIGFVVLLGLFRLLELTRPRERRLPVLRRGFRTDLCYWLFTPIVTRAATRIGVLVAAVPILLLAYGKVDRDLILHGFGPAATLPWWVQAAAILVIGDFIGYWMHRWFHRGRAWRFHAIHHSSVDLDWLSSVRLHPVNDLLMRLATALPVLALGFAPVAFAAVAPVFTLLAIAVHANLDWDWGPLRAVFVSPRFHRWHHTAQEEGRDRNFAGLLPLWDILFGTWYMPNGRAPERFGTDTPVPEGLLGQLAAPFRRS